MAMSSASAASRRKSAAQISASLVESAASSSEHSALDMLAFGAEQEDGWGASCTSECESKQEENESVYSYIRVQRPPQGHPGSLVTGMCCDSDAALESEGPITIAHLGSEDSCEEPAGPSSPVEPAFFMGVVAAE